MKVLAAHQPNFLPYLGFFDKLERCDVFVIRDEVLYVERDFHHRNRIRSNGNDNLNDPQSTWLTVPVNKQADYIKNITIKENAQTKGKNWKDQMLHAVQVNYGRAPYFEAHYENLQRVIQASNGSLLDLNMGLIRLLNDAFGINKPIVFASELGLKPEKYEKSDPSEDLVKICQKLGADVYLSGNGAKEYLKLDVFDRAGIKVVWQDYNHPVYKQAFPGFLPYMSAIDALFCVGKMPKKTDTIGEEHVAHLAAS